MRTKTIEISLSKWKRGAIGEGYTKLLNPYGWQCCLGFMCRAYGLRIQDIKDVGFPDKVKDRLERLPAFMRTRAWNSTIASINDRLLISDSARQKKLKAEFLKKGIIIVFVE